jgi:hypothetical protein
VDGFSTRTYTDEQLEELEAKEQEQHEYKGKSYNAYQASQAQRQMETTMRAESEYQESEAGKCRFGYHSSGSGEISKHAKSV